jgi:pyrroline-5-carboxylate reductase
MDRSIGFVGGGRVARILIGGLARSGKLPREVSVYDPDRRVLEDLTSKYSGIRGVGTSAEAAAQNVVFLAVHPPVLSAAVGEIRDSLNPVSVLVSLAPVVTIAKLSELSGGFGRIARMIPNAPSLIGKGYNPVSFAESLLPEERSHLEELFAPWGRCPIVPESTLEAYAIATAMGPTYFWPQLYELTALAESFGLTREAALEGIGVMIEGAASAMSLSEMTAEEVQDLIPVKPLAEDVEVLTRAYRQKLTGLFEKLGGKK